MLFVVCRILVGQRKSTYGGLKATCLELLSNHIQSPHLMSFLIDIYEEEALDKEMECRLDSLSQALEVQHVVAAVFCNCYSLTLLLLCIVVQKAWVRSGHNQEEILGLSIQETGAGLQGVPVER